ncbi:uncharacterized protein A4U43_C03F1050 [Asparagus officinalis]|uniref:Uncharacterized protein n=1 Tax=Asparagus officinalis TaxID=4686 RepID=A0A5P1FBB6_ASPOF|nr:uncharacterized protein LOC109832489 [Asparagus officinalis]ONK73931.1 uncharacterized protein A4U43_C03F1050 [Asparagus officinalis]
MASASTLPPSLPRDSTAPGLKIQFCPPLSNPPKTLTLISSQSLPHPALLLLLLILEREEVRWPPEQAANGFAPDGGAARLESPARIRGCRDLERESLIREIAALRARIQALERGRAMEEVDAEIRARPLLAEDADVRDMVFEEVRVSGRGEEKKENVREVKEMVFEEARVSKDRRVLRKGAEGDDVREMQVSLVFIIS